MTIDGIFEQKKFDSRREPFRKYLNELQNSDYEITEILEHFPAFVGHMTLLRCLTIYELYKKTEGIAGHIADVGVFKGGSAILFSKLIKIFESESLTQVHGFDWFKGMGKDIIKNAVHEGHCEESEERLKKLIHWQGLNDNLILHNLDLTKELDPFFDKYKHLMFKLIFLDAGQYAVLKEAIPHFWDRLIPGGIMVFDQFNHELAPGESLAVREFLPDIKIRTINNSWMPTAFAIKPSKD